MIDMSRIDRIHEPLDEAQGIPVVGPLFVSPVKAVAGIVEIIVSIVASIFLTASAFRESLCHPNAALLSVAKTVFVAGTLDGLRHSLCAIANICTLGLLSQRIAEVSRSKGRYIVAVFNHS
jgi:hypothetical protein